MVAKLAVVFEKRRAVLRTAPGDLIGAVNPWLRHGLTTYVLRFAPDQVNL